MLISVLVTVILVVLQELIPSRHPTGKLGMQAAVGFLRKNRPKQESGLSLHKASSVGLLLSTQRFAATYLISNEIGKYPGAVRATIWNDLT